MPVAAQFKVWVCGRSLAGIVGSNTAGACMSLVSSIEVSATGRSHVQRSLIAVCVCVCV